MRFMMIVKASKDSEAEILPREAEIAAMMKFNQKMAKAGVMLAGEGLRASSKGARVRFRAGKRAVTHGPFTGARQLVAGFWQIEVRSKEEAIEWAKRAPFKSGEIELRQILEADDFGAEFTPELRDQSERLRAQLEAKP